MACMKKTILCVISLLLIFVLTACENEMRPVDSSWHETATVSQVNERLTVFCIGPLRDSQMVHLALDLYRAQYPEVEVNLLKPETNGDFDLAQELFTQVAAQIMAGEGPDVFIIDDTIMDVEKLVRQGIFADMEPFFQADNFDWEPYNQAVMDGGVWNGKRFVIPLSYDFPLLFTTKTALAETGFNTEACVDFQGFLDETTRFLEDSTQKRQLFYNPLVVVDVADLSGIPVADYDTKAIDLLSPVFQKGIQWYKTVMENHPNGRVPDADYLGGAAAVRDGKALWTTSLLGALDCFYHDFGALKTIDEAVMMPIRDVNGGIQAEIEDPVAVRANSENLQNAYNFIKILLSEEVQCAYSGEELSVLNASNEYFYQENVAGRWLIVPAGEQGFTSTVDPLLAINWPTAEEFQEFVSFTQEISEVHYASHLGLSGAFRPYVYENADFEETLQAVQQQLEIRISE